jgi:hypothetical protein
MATSCHSSRRILWGKAGKATEGYLVYFLTKSLSLTADSLPQPQPQQQQGTLSWHIMNEKNNGGT